MSSQNYAMSITFGECVETHAGMEMTGKTADIGFTVKELEQIAEKYPERSELYYLHDQLPDDIQKDNEAVVLVLRQGIELFDVSLEELKSEQLSLEFDKKAKMRGRVVNKVARWNLCYADHSQEPDYEQGKGRIVNFKDVTNLETIRDQLHEIFGEKAEKLFAELNVYYEPTKTCGIGFHGDTERRKVICIRMGVNNPMQFQWFYRYQPVFDRINIELKEGDIYIMSDKATGYDWKKSSIHTLRHAAGAPKYLEIKDKKSKEGLSYKELQAICKELKKEHPEIKCNAKGEVLKAWIEEFAPERLN